MKNLFSELKRVEERIKKTKFILLVLDFDGTLVDIKPTPAQVLFPEKTRRLLSLLARDANKSVGIISGRSLSDIRRIVGLRNVFYAGNHGFEIKLLRSKKFVHARAKKSRRLIKSLTKTLKKRLLDFEGVLIEDKTYTLSVHYRNCPQSQIRALKKTVRDLCLPLVEEGKMEITGGKKVIEIRPPVRWNKGEALCWIKDRLKKKEILTIYIGDDKTDEDAFAKVKNGFGVYVGARRKHSHAGFYLSDPRQVVKFLTWLLNC